MDELKSEILILSHGPFCTAALETARMIGGDQKGITAIPLDEDMSMEEYADKVTDAISKMPEGSLVMVDLFGGTPFKKVAKLLSDFPVYAVTGFNLAMLIEAMSSRCFLTGEKLQEQALAAAHTGIKNINAFLHEIERR